MWFRWERHGCGKGVWLKLDGRSDTGISIKFSSLKTTSSPHCHTCVGPALDAPEGDSTSMPTLSPVLIDDPMLDLLWMVGKQEREIGVSEAGEK